MSIFKNTAKKVLYHHILVAALKTAIKERKEMGLVKKLEQLVPNLTHQYTSFSLDMNNPYLKYKVRGQHAFQVSLAMKAFHLLSKKNEKVNIVDVGDSAGTHLIYLKNLLTDSNCIVNTLSVNVDHAAVEKIKSKGLHAIQCRAEELHLHPEFNQFIDLFLSYEMLEHLIDPISFLRQMALKANCELFSLTVPYVRCSRVGMHHIRKNLSHAVNAEVTHIFELAPEDWKLLFKFSGWEVIYEDKYTQYPKKNLLTNLTKFIWRKMDFDGFYGVVLRKNPTVSDQYQSW